MRKLLKRNLFISFSLIICLLLASCGKSDEVVVDDYAESVDDSSKVSNSTDTDSVRYNSSNETSLKDLYGDRLTWKDSFVVDDSSVNVDTYYMVPDEPGLNVYHNTYYDDGLADEAAIVQALFGDTGKKLEEIKYTNETDYMTMLYKYRDIKSIYDQYTAPMDDDEDVIILSAEENHFVIDSSFTETYKWLDDDKMYIHMYEGTYEGIKFGLILAYNYISKAKYIFFEPISIKDYFPDFNCKSLFITTSIDTAGNPVEIDNNCSDSIEEIKLQASDFLSNKLLLKNDIPVTEDSSLYRIPMANNYVSYMYAGLWNNLDEGPSVLRFTDVDYISSIDTYYEYKGVDYSILAEQKDIYKEYLETHEGDSFFDFMSSFSSDKSDRIEEGDSFVDGYAVYLDDGANLFANDAEMYSSVMTQNSVGIIQYTSRGLYSADITLYSKTIDITENVKLLEFDQITESLKEELQEPGTLDMDKLKDPHKINIYRYNLTYYPYWGDMDSDSGEFMFIPVWDFFVVGDTSGNQTADIYVNAMDGSLVEIFYHTFE